MTRLTVGISCESLLILKRRRLRVTSRRAGGRERDGGSHEMVGEIGQETGNPSALRAAHGFEKIQEFCRGPYRVVREGKTSGR